MKKKDIAERKNSASQVTKIIITPSSELDDKSLDFVDSKLRKIKDEKVESGNTEDDYDCDDFDDDEENLLKKTAQEFGNKLKEL